MKPISKEVISHESNTGVISYMQILSNSGGMVHPDLSEYFRQMKRTTTLSHRKHFRSEVLICNNTCEIRAVAFGTGYAIKVAHNIKLALKKNKKQVIEWSDGDNLNLTITFGEDWVEGTFDDAEAQWLS